jgi:hypothetical protein
MNCYIAFRIEYTVTENDMNYQYRMCTSKTPFKETDTAEDIDNKMTNVTEERWREMFKYCQGYLNEKRTSKEYFIVEYTTLKYGQILEQIGRR